MQIIKILALISIIAIIAVGIYGADRNGDLGRIRYKRKRFTKK